jgi:hypothetical protein
MPRNLIFSWASGGAELFPQPVALQSHTPPCVNQKSITKECDPQRGAGKNKMTPNSTNARRNIKQIAFRVAENGARIRNLHAESSRNQVSLLMLVHKMRFREQLRWRHHGGGTKVDPGPAKAQPKYYKSQIEDPHIANAVGGIYTLGRLGAPSRCVGLAWQFMLLVLARSEFNSE